MIPIVYADASILVCIKPAGLLAQVDSAGGISMVSCLEEQTGSRKGIFPVHRLDKGVGGLMVYALTKQAAADLSEQIRSGVFHKTYYAAVSGHPEPPAGEMT
ncbi:MAG: RluA family pseudouridine synthase, partial [Oscillospiraceae bacterium]|nr:RluA family pseudouridine synthase [Oscillospiraceae bacterium]